MPSQNCYGQKSEIWIHEDYFSVFITIPIKSTSKVEVGIPNYITITGLSMKKYGLIKKCLASCLLTLFDVATSAKCIGIGNEDTCYSTRWQLGHKGRMNLNYNWNPL